MDTYSHYLVLVVMVIAVAWLYWLIAKGPKPPRARVANRCTRCGCDLIGAPDRCPKCSIEIDYDDHIAGELDAGLLQQDWPSTPVSQRAPGLAEEAITVHTTTNMHEANRLQEQLAARGYACRLETVESSRTYPGLGPAALTFNIKVYAEDLAAARHYVRGLRRAARLKRTSMMVE
jgi:hypothetical protein